VLLVLAVVDIGLLVAEEVELHLQIQVVVVKVVDLVALMVVVVRELTLDGLFPLMGGLVPVEVEEDLLKIQLVLVLVVLVFV
tara:strand:+ start:396 stop:641 length:246 start_codon:yes stop_codon:yes gene_type:complete